MADNSVIIEGSGNIQIGSSYNQLGDKIYVLNGGTISNFTIANGAVITISSGGIASNTIISNQGVAFVYSQAVAYGTIINGGNQTISNGGVAYDTIINVGGKQIVTSGAITNNVSVNSGGTQSVTGRATVNSTTLSGGTLIVEALANANNTLVGDNGTLSVFLGSTINTIVDSSGKLYNIQGTTSSTIINGGGILIAGGYTTTGIANNYNTIINSGGQAIIGSNTAQNKLGSAIDYNAQIYGSQSVLSGSIASNATIFSGGYQDIKSGGHVFGTIVSSSGLLNLEDGATISGTITVESGGSAVIYNSAGGAINLVGDSNGGVTISGLANGGELNTVLTVISGFNGQSAGNSDIITLSGIKSTDVKLVEYVDATGAPNGDYVTLTLTNDQKITLHIIGAQTAGYSLGVASDGSVTYEVCFLAGTMIKTPNGEKVIEDLCVGDQVITFDWKHNREVSRPICWVGNKKLIVNSDCAADKAGYPVRILKNAIAEGLPYKDLLVTAEHCLFFEDKFIPARMLINDSSIYYDCSITEYTYYHIETEEHSIIWADGALTESYLDTGNRYQFRQQGNLVLFNKLLGSKNWDTNAGAPLTVQRSMVEPVYNQIMQRAISVGFIPDNKKPLLTGDPDLHLVTKEGQPIYPHSNHEGKYVFSLPENVEIVYLYSRTSRPCDVIGSFVDDRRNLGVLVSDIFIFTYDEMYQIKDHLLQNNLKGWDVIEHEYYRWTNGCAELNLHQYISPKRIIVIQTIPSNSYIIDNENNILKKQNIA